MKQLAEMLAELKERTESLLHLDTNAQPDRRAVAHQLQDLADEEHDPDEKRLLLALADYLAEHDEQQRQRIRQDLAGILNTKAI